MEIDWGEMDYNPETGFEQQADDLVEQAEQALEFEIPEECNNEKE